MALYCPEDSSNLEPINYSPSIGEAVYECAVCGGVFTSQRNKEKFKAEKLPDRLLGKELKCPRDGAFLRQDGGRFVCDMCGGAWLPKEKKEDNIKSLAVKTTAQTLGLIIGAVLLFNWQMGFFNAGADTVVSATTLEPMRIAAIITWFVIFLFIFLIPASVYEQVILAHRPHQRKVLHNPIVRWMPAFVILLMAISIYFLTPY